MMTLPSIEPRVGQLDANILDSELLDLLKSQLFSCFKYFRPEIKDKYESELLLVLKLILFKVTIWDHSATYGSKLQNLKLVDRRSAINRIIPMSRNQKLSYGFIIIGGNYFWNKLEDYQARMSNLDYEEEMEGTRAGRINIAISKKLRVVIDSLSTVWTVSSLANFVLFLYSGKYSTLILRLLRIKYIPTSRTLTRQVNFEFQNRQLVWNAFTEFLLFILPLVNIQKVKRRLMRVFSTFLGNGASSAEGKKEKDTGELAFLPEKTCAICYKSTSADSSTATVSTDVTNPYQGECGHIYCYVCLKTKLAEDPEEGFRCLRCNKQIKNASPYKDVDLSTVCKQPEIAAIEGEEKENEKEKEREREREGAESESSDEGTGYTGSDEEADYVMEDEMDESNFFVEGDDF